MKNKTLTRALTSGLVLAGASCALAQSATTTAPASAPAAAPASAATTIPEPTPPPKWESNVKLGFAYTSGNSDTLLLTGSFATERKGPKDEWSFGAEGAYGKNDGTVNNELAHGFGQYNYLFTDRFYAYGRADGLYDGMAGIDYRVLLSPGVGYYVIKAPKTSLSFEVGPGYVWEKKGGVTDDYFTIRFGERFEQKLNDKAKLWQSLSYLPQVSDWGNYQVSFQVGVEAMIAKALALNVIATDLYYSRPAAGKKENDFLLSSGLTYKF